MTRSAPAGPQRPGLAHAASMQIMIENSPGKFDPLLLGAFNAAPSNSNASSWKSPDSITSISPQAAG